MALIVRILGDVLAGLAVAARGGLHQAAVFVAQADRQAVELEFTEVVGFFGWAQEARAAQRIGHAAVEGFHVLGLEGIAQRQHGHGVADAAKGRDRRRADTLGG